MGGLCCTVYGIPTEIADCANVTFVDYGSPALTAARLNGTTYSRLINAMKKADISLNRKMLADLAVNTAQGFYGDYRKSTRCDLEFSSSQKRGMSKIQDKINKRDDLNGHPFFY